MNTAEAKQKAKECVKNGVVDFEEIRKLPKKDRQLLIGVIKKTFPVIDVPTAEDMEMFSIKLNRQAYDTFPDRLPTFGKMPVPPDEHKKIGEYESKQNLYLLIAHAYNTIMDRLDSLQTK